MWARPASFILRPSSLFIGTRIPALPYDHVIGESLPYAIAVLCYLFDEQGRVLLLRRRKCPNRDLYSPVGGKLEQSTGESPTACAVREIGEETGLELSPADLHLTGIVSERGYEDRMHWLMFLYETLGPVDVPPGPVEEGLLEWHHPAALDSLPIPETDRKIIWPMFWKYRYKFFVMHIDCGGDIMNWRIEQPPNGRRSRG